MKVFQFFAKYISYSFSIALFNSFVIIFFSLFSMMLALTFFPDQAFGLYSEYGKLFLIITISVVFIYYLTQGFFNPMGLGAISSRNRRINREIKNLKSKDKKQQARLFVDLTRLINGSPGTAILNILLIHLALASFFFHSYMVGGLISFPQFMLFVKIISLSFILGITLAIYPAGKITAYLANRHRMSLLPLKNKRGKEKLSFIFTANFFKIHLMVLILINFLFLLVIINNYFYENINEKELHISIALFGILFFLLFLNVITGFKKINSKLIMEELNFHSEEEGNGGDSRRIALTHTSRELEELFYQIFGAKIHLKENLKKKEEKFRLQSGELHERELQLASFEEKFKKIKDVTNLVHSLSFEKSENNLKFFQFSLENHMEEENKKLFLDKVSVNDETVAGIFSFFTEGEIPSDVINFLGKTIFRRTLNKLNSKDDAPHVLTELQFKLNRFLQDDSGSSYFAFIMDSDQNFMYISSANSRPVKVNRENGEVLFLDSTDMYLDETSEEVYPSTSSIKINRGDRIVFYNRAILNRKNENEENYSFERILRAIEKNRFQSLSSMGHNLKEDILSFFENAMGEREVPLVVLESVFDKSWEYIRDAEEFIEAGREEEAVKILEEGLEQLPGNETIMYNLAKSYFRVKNYSGAVKILEKYFKRETGNEFAHYVMGASCFQLEEYERAIESFLLSLEIAPAMKNSMFALAMSYKQIGNNEEALAKLEEILELDPENRAARDAMNEIVKLMGHEA